MIVVGSQLWQYLSPTQRALARDGEFLTTDAVNHSSQALTDYSYLVFPYAKLYEGFLKQLFLDIHVINRNDYESDHFRIGKALSPSFSYEHGGPSVYRQIESRYGKSFALLLWTTWKECRNMVFHYFPHNFRALRYPEACKCIKELVNAMEEAVAQTGIAVGKNTSD